MKINQIIFDKDIHEKAMKIIGDTDNIVSFIDRYIDIMYKNSKIELDYNTFKTQFLNNISQQENIEEISEKLQSHSEGLEDNVSKAKVAIEKQDEKTLSAVLAEIKKMQAELKELNHELYEDELTKCYNRKYIKKLTNNSEEFTDSGTFVIIDFDKFKHINDTYGHMTGDKVLISISHLIKTAINRHMDGENTKLIRYGGDEFFIVHYGDEKDKLHTIMSKLQEKLTQMHFENSKKDFKFKANFSFGISDFKKGEKFGEVLSCADENLYIQKEERKKAGLR